MKEDVVERVRQFVRDTFMYMQPDAVLTDDALLLSEGILDSMGVVELIEFLRSEFAIEVADEEITEEHLGSLRAVAEYVNAKRASHAMPPS